MSYNKVMASNRYKMIVVYIPFKFLLPCCHVIIRSDHAQVLSPSELCFLDGMIAHYFLDNVGAFKAVTHVEILAVLMNAVYKL